MRAIVAVTVAVLLTSVVAPDVEASRAARPGSWRAAAAARLGKLRRPPRKGGSGTLGRARDAASRLRTRGVTRVKRTAARSSQRIARAGIFVGLATVWLGAAKAEPAHQMKFVVGGIAIALVGASVAWVRMVRDGRRAAQAYHDEFHADFDAMFEDFARFAADDGSAAGGQPPRVMAPEKPRPPEGTTWPVDLEAAFDEMAAATSKDQLSKIYRKAARRYHPDTGGDLEQSKALNAFYTGLQAALD